MECIHIENKGKVCIVSINNPAHLNVIDTQTLEALGQALDGIAASGGTSCLVITGEGEKAFCGGADIAQMADMPEEEARAFALLGKAVLSKIETMRFPVIAAVNGYALGGGCELAMACDIIIASQNAVFAQQEITLGVIPGFGGTQRLKSRIGTGRAKKMIFTGEFLSAGQAFEIGLADQVVKSENFMDEVMALAEKIASQSESALFAAKAAVSYDGAHGFDKGMALETELFCRCFSMEDQKKAMRSFLKRKK